eukprot:gene17708-57402_t
MTEEFTTSKLSMGRDIVKKNNKPDVAAGALNSICQEVYTHLFNWLVRKHFQTNGFEQLCINLANEMLQKHYNDHIFKADMEECKSEGIDVSHITYKDNQHTVDLLSKKGGVLAKLDDQCKSRGDPRDPKMEAAFEQKLESLTQHESFHKGPLDHGKFTIGHYAGATLKASSNSLVQELVGGITGEKTTTSQTFRSSLSDLIKVINGTVPSWVRCIKPNPAKRPKEFDAVSTCEQLRCSGVLDTINIRKSGYPVRSPLPGFACRRRWFAAFALPCVAVWVCGR